LIASRLAVIVAEELLLRSAIDEAIDCIGGERIPVEEEEGFCRRYPLG
jgi:hypothetical protein